MPLFFDLKSVKKQHNHCMNANYHCTHCITAMVISELNCPKPSAKATYPIGMEIALSDIMIKTIAITVWNDIVSPFYDASCCLEIIRPDNIHKIINVRNMSLYEKADCCRNEGVAVVICGAISTIGKATLQDNTIEVLSWTPTKSIS